MKAERWAKNVKSRLKLDNHIIEFDKIKHTLTARYIRLSARGELPMQI